jgi:hypothetical protein
MPDTINRWQLRIEQKGLNPGAGIGVGRAESPRSDKEMAVPTRMSKGPAPWHPTVINLVVLILLEMVAYAALRYAFRTAHGG